MAGTRKEHGAGTCGGREAEENNKNDLGAHMEIVDGQKVLVVDGRKLTQAQVAEELQEARDAVIGQDSSSPGAREQKLAMLAEAFIAPGMVDAMADQAVRQQKRPDRKQRKRGYTVRRAPTVVPQVGKQANKPCACGSGKKTKKCCGRVGA